MTDPVAPSLYAEIEETLAGSPQGRAFLAEHARRSRGGDTQALLDAVARLEARVGSAPMAGDIDRLRSDVAEMADEIRRTKTDLAAMAPQDRNATRLADAAQALDGIVATTEKATSDILDATEKVQEAAWRMRERGFDPDLCDRLDAHATEIYTACCFQDLTAQRIGRVVRSLKMLEGRIISLSRLWGEPDPAPGTVPPLEESQALLSNDDIDFVLVDALPSGHAPAILPEASEAGPRSTPEDGEAALAELRRLAELGTRDRLRLFT